MRTIRTNKGMWWRFNNPSPQNQLKILKQWVKDYMG
jgi:transposase-like protein